MKKLKTETRGHKDQPCFVICPGHVNIGVFNQAFRNEGWSDSGEWEQKDLNYIYGHKLADKTFKKCSPTHSKAKKFTYAKWD